MRKKSWRDVSAKPLRRTATYAPGKIAWLSGSGGSLEILSALIRVCNPAIRPSAESDTPDYFVERAYEPLEDPCNETCVKQHR